MYTRFDQLAKEHDRPLLEIAEMFMKVSGDFEALKMALGGKAVVEWTTMDDHSLTQPEHSIEYKQLLAAKGIDEVERRKKFFLAKGYHLPVDKKDKMEE